MPLSKNFVDVTKKCRTCDGTGSVQIDDDECDECWDCNDGRRSIGKALMLPPATLGGFPYAGAWPFESRVLWDWWLFNGGDFNE